MASFNCGEKTAALFLVRGLAHIHDADVRHFLVVHALGQFEQREVAAFAVVKTFERRRGRAEHDDGMFHLAAHDRDIARVIARRFLLLVSVLVFLVHDDEAERFDRRKNRRARADDDARPALPDFVPFVVPFAGAKDANAKRRRASAIFPN